MRPVDTLMVVVVLALVVPSASAFGYVTMEDTVALSPGDTYTFRYYLFGEESVEQTRVTAPATWDIRTSPAHIDLGEATATRSIPMGDTYRPAVPATLTVSVPLNAAPGTYRIGPIYTAQQVSGSSTLQVQQRQPIPFTVSVRELEAVTRAERDGSDVAPATEDRPAGSTTPAGAITGDSPIDDGDTPADGARNWYAVGVFAAFILFQILWVGYILRRRSTQ